MIRVLPVVAFSFLDLNARTMDWMVLVLEDVVTVGILIAAEGGLVMHLVMGLADAGQSEHDGGEVSGQLHLDVASVWWFGDEVERNGGRVEDYIGGRRSSAIILRHNFRFGT
jgi:hypothetical protein